mmetsp:Transcript_18445/g.53186  ORF Transcript_18445/g.53186 Transcript_18445/m.53186 type:complete len:99 (-) Transcript_18445:127-423(-)
MAQHPPQSPHTIWNPMFHKVAAHKYSPTFDQLRKGCRDRNAEYTSRSTYGNGRMAAFDGTPRRGSNSLFLLAVNNAHFHTLHEHVLWMPPNLHGHKER